MISYKNDKGFALVEILLAITIIGLFVGAIVTGYLYGEESSQISGDTLRATMIAKEGIEAVRNIRDSSFSNLSAGTHGLAVSGGVWGFSGSSDTSGIFTRQISISNVDSNRRQVESIVTWQENGQRTGTVQETTYFTNWQVQIASCNAYVIVQGYSAGTCRPNASQCSNNGETHLSDGDAYCTGGASADTCCAAP